MRTMKVELEVDVAGFENLTGQEVNEDDVRAVLRTVLHPYIVPNANIAEMRKWDKKEFYVCQLVRRLHAAVFGCKVVFK